MKRIRPAPMGRAFRVVKRTAHLTVRVAERPVVIAAVGPGDAPKRGAKPATANVKAAAAPAAKAPARRRATPAKKKSATPKKK
jgi:large subunit ribosomal protein L22